MPPFTETAPSPVPRLTFRVVNTPYPDPADPVIAKLPVVPSELPMVTVAADTAPPSAMVSSAFPAVPITRLLPRVHEDPLPVTLARLQLVASPTKNPYELDTVAPLESASEESTPASEYTDTTAEGWANEPPLSTRSPASIVVAPV